MPKKCPILECKLARPELDHDHLLGNVRQVISGTANALIGKIENFARTYMAGKTNLSLPDVLRNVADYLEEDYSENPFHPNHRKVVRRLFLKTRRDEQVKALNELGIDVGDLRNAKERADEFVNAVLEPYKQ